jgi:hypothetical protein
MWIPEGGGRFEVYPEPAMKNTDPSKRSVLGASGLLLIVSFFFPYSEVLLATSSQAEAPQLSIYVSHASGPLLARLPATAGLSRLVDSTTAAAGLAVGLLALSAALAARPWAMLLRLPAMLLPAVVCADAAGFLAACEPPELTARLGAGAFVAWGVAALLAGTAFSEIWKFSSAGAPKTTNSR